MTSNGQDGVPFIGDRGLPMNIVGVGGGELRNAFAAVSCYAVSLLIQIERSCKPRSKHAMAVPLLMAQLPQVPRGATRRTTVVLDTFFSMYSMRPGENGVEMIDDVAIRLIGGTGGRAHKRKEVVKKCFLQVLSFTAQIAIWRTWTSIE